MVGDEVSCFSNIERVGNTSITVKIESWVRRRFGYRTNKSDRGHIHLRRRRCRWPASTGTDARRQFKSTTRSLICLRHRRVRRNVRRAPDQLVIVEPVVEHRFDDRKKRRHIKIARRVKDVLANMLNLALNEGRDAVGLSVDDPALRQDWIAYRCKCLRNKSRTDCLRGSPLPIASIRRKPHRHWWIGEQITSQVDNFLLSLYCLPSRAKA